MPCQMLWQVCRVQRIELDRPRVWVDVPLCTRRSGIGKIQLKHLDSFSIVTWAFMLNFYWSTKNFHIDTVPINTNKYWGGGLK